MKKELFMKQFVKENYAKIAKGEKRGCCSGGHECDGGDKTGLSALAGYSPEERFSAGEGADMGLGCGNPIALAEISEGDVVLDLGSGGGFDCFLARQRTGKSGYVIGVDMTPEMIRLGRENALKIGYENVEFILGDIENLPLPDERADVIISNCVINLSSKKLKVFSEAYRVLKKGGRFCVSDIMATAEIPYEVRENPALFCACIGGAERVEEVEKMMREAGFKDVRITQKEESREMIRTWAPDAHAEAFAASFYIRAVK